MPIQHFGAALKALRLSGREELTIRLSGGGEIRSEVTRVQWCLPMAGCVRTEATLRATDSQGAVSTATSAEQLRRGVFNDVSWPGRVRLFSSLAALPSSPRRFVPIAGGPTRRITFATGTGFDDPLAARVFDVATGELRASVDLPTPADGIDAFWRPSPDRTRLYAVQSRRPPAAAGASGDTAMPIADASAAGALTLRLDAATLQEELRIALPAQPSANWPGFGFARHAVNTFLVSPGDPTHFAVESFGALLVRGDQVASQVLFDPAAEFVGSNRMLLKQHANLLAWDAVAGTIHLYDTPLFGMSGPLIVPVGPSGLVRGDARPGITLMDGGFPVFQPGSDDRYTIDRVFVSNYAVAFDKATGALLGRSDLPYTAGLDDPLATRCDLDAGRIVCFRDDFGNFTQSIVELDAANLGSGTRIELQNDLRFLAHGHYPSLIRGFFTQAPGEYAMAAASTSFPSVPLRIYRLKSGIGR